MKLLENCWSELLLLDVLYKQLEHSDTDHLLMVSTHLSFHSVSHHVVKSVVSAFDFLAGFRHPGMYPKNPVVFLGTPT